MPDNLSGKLRELAEYARANYLDDGHIEELRLAADQLDALEADKERWQQAESNLSDAYVRLRKLIPGAFATPFAPTGEQVWATTEAALQALLARHAQELAEKDAKIGALQHLVGELNDDVAEVAAERDRAVEALRGVGIHAYRDELGSISDYSCWTCQSKWYVKPPPNYWQPPGPFVETHNPVTLNGQSGPCPCERK